MSEKTYILEACDLYKYVPIGDYELYGLDPFEVGDPWNKRNYVFILDEFSAIKIRLSCPGVRLIPNFDENT